MKIKPIVFLFVFAFSMLFFGCSEENKFKVDISKIKNEVEIKRLDKDILEFDTINSATQIVQFKKKYGEFFRLYNLQIIKIGSCTSKEYPEKLSSFLKYCENENLPQQIEVKFNDFTLYQKQISDAFKHYRYYFPEKNVPKIYTCISGFLQSVSTGDSIAAISLDKYLGYQTKAYQKLGWDNYRRLRMIPEMISVDLMRAWAMADFPYQSTSDNLLDNMIYQGKIQYYMDCMLPETQDSLKWSYTKKQMGWAARNEDKIWTFLVDKKLLFTTEQLEIRKYVGDGPFTSPFAAISAPRAAVFIGYQIVDSYMNNNKQVSLARLMEENDARKILAGAKYKP